jgi:hypothetical protein
MTGSGKPRILCLSVSFSGLAQMCAALPVRQYQVLSASNLLDSEFFADDGCTLAQTFKAVNPHMPIVLLERGHHGDIPDAVDAVATTKKMLLKAGRARQVFRVIIFCPFMLSARSLLASGPRFPNFNSSNNTMGTHPAAFLRSVGFNAASFIESLSPGTKCTQSCTFSPASASNPSGC